MDYLTMKEVADLKGCSWQNIQRLVKSNKLDFIQEMGCKGRMKYLIPVSVLSEDLQAKYYAKMKKDSGLAPELKNEPETVLKQSPKRVQRTFEELSEEERTRLNFWCSLLEEWRARRSQYRNKTEFDYNFIGECRLKYEDIEISERILYRKWTAYKNNDYDGIIGVRGGWNKGSSSIPETVWDDFLWEWLNENKPTVSLCYRSTVQWTAEFYPELLEMIPSEATFRRRIDRDVAVAVKTLMRDGEKAFNDRCAPYIMRMYDKLEANDCWIADTHTLDIQSYDDKNSIHRLYLTAFLDAKSGVLTGWNIDDSANSDSVTLALRHGIIHYGIPKCIYVDNGREYLNHQLGGRGRRVKKNENPESEPPPIFKRLGIEMRNAIVRNAKAKPIERTFYTVKNQFSKLWDGFCGGTIIERPESLKRRIKDGKLPCDYEIREILDTWIKNEYNLQPYGGSEQKYKGMSRLDVWNKTCSEMRKISESALNLMLMRTTRKQKIKRNGVYVTICGEKIWFMEARETIMNLEKEVYVRYDPADLRTARIYDAETDKYMFTWSNADQLMVDYLTEKKEEISDAKAIIGESKKFIREQAKGIKTSLSNHQKLTLLEMTVRNAHNKKFRIVQPKKIVPVIINETAEDRMAAGAENVTIDLKRMRKNAEMRRKK